MMSSPLQISHLDSTSVDFNDSLARLLSWHEESDQEVEATVRAILADVRREGDEAVLRYTNTFDRQSAECITDLVIEREQILAALDDVPDSLKEALMRSAERIRRYHEHQQQESWSYTEANGNRLGQQITALDRVGLYVPGGKAAYPSSVLMASIPAKVAGVEEVVMVSPAPEGKMEPAVLAAAAVAGVDRIFTIGGAQAIGALAYGTDSVPKVDKIVGPGNIFVATAKRQVFGIVDIDMIAGPSEILVVSDGNSDPDWVAMDLFSQAEHDEQAQSILLSPCDKFIDAVSRSLDQLISTMPRRDIITASLNNRGALIKVRDLDEAMIFVNRIAPEHLELAIDNPEPWLAKVRHAGAIFMGQYTSESLGDYCAGPNHVLPTSGTARFSSPLGVYDYVKRSSVIYCSKKGAAELGEIASTLARSEFLEAHAQSAEYRIQKNKVNPYYS